VHSAIHLDLEYDGIDNLKAGLYNNISFYTQKPENMPTYDPGIAQITDIYTDESSFIIYNELDVGYTVTDFFRPSVIVRNYYASMTGRGGVKAQDYGINMLSAELRASFRTSGHTEFRVGLKYASTSYDTPKSSDVLLNSHWTIGIPVGISFTW